MKWTSEQERAIYDRGGTLLISAAAGSGKTAVLVERAVALMTDEKAPIDADRMLIVTFSNAAAAEVRARISKRLNEKSTEQPGNWQIEKQKLLLGNAKIETVHAFCLDLMREFFNDLGIPPDFSVETESTLTHLREDALYQAMEEAYEDQAFIKLAAMFGRARNDIEVQKAILKLYSFSRALPFPKQQLHQMVEMYSVLTPVAESLWGKELLQYSAVVIEQGLQAVLCAATIAKSNEQLAPYLKALLQEQEILEQLKEAVDASNWNKAVAVCEERKWPPLSGVRGVEELEKTKVKSKHAQAKKCFELLAKDVFFCTEEKYIEDAKLFAPYAKALVEVTLRFQELYFNSKLEEKVLEFSDFEHLAIQLLYKNNEETSDVAKAIRDRFDVIMVDEFQDTSDIQERIFEAVANEEKNNLFFVGDMKQSIYRFRQANPDIFGTKKEKYAPISAQQYPAKIVLGNNFRSSNAVIDGVNDLFSTLMSKQVGELNYTSEEYLIAGTADYAGDTSFEFHIVTQEAKGNSEAKYVARKIEEMVVQGEIVQEKNGTLRPCRYNDFCILMRSPGSAGASYKIELEQRRIPVYSDMEQNLLQSPVLQPVIAALQVIDNPAQDIPLAAVMLSPLFNFSPDEINALRAKQKRGPLFSVILNSDDEKVVSFLGDLQYFRNLSAVQPVHEIVEAILQKTNYDVVAPVQPGAEQAGEELRTFIEWAETYGKTGYGGLTGFVKTIEQTAEGIGYRKQNAMATKEGQVSLMSIHRSKGLEFPFCFLVETAKKFNKIDLSNPILYHAKLGIGASLKTSQHTLSPTLPKLAIRHKLEQELLSEEMRLLYVALTRGKQKVILSMADKTPQRTVQKLYEENGGTVTPFMLAQQSNAAKWLLSAFLTHKNAEILREMAGAPQQLVRETTGELVVVIHEGSSEKKTQEKKGTPAVEDVTLTQKLLQQFDKKYTFASLANVPIKMSVSQIAKGSTSATLERPSFMYKDGLSAAERGTALHSFMQFANYVNARGNFHAELERLVKQGFMSAETAAAVPEKDVLLFLQSDLVKRMRDSEKMYREYDFITEIPAANILQADKNYFEQTIMVQGIADCVFVERDGAVLVDYKTDRVRTEEELITRYKKQLELYKLALEPRLKTKIKQCILYSFHLHKEVELF